MILAECKLCSVKNISVGGITASSYSTGNLIKHLQCFSREHEVDEAGYPRTQSKIERKCVGLCECRKLERGVEKPLHMRAVHSSEHSALRHMRALFRGVPLCVWFR